jgi:uncharacterized membrane protein YphA (DoxX/SURF4 family)
MPIPPPYSCRVGVYLQRLFSTFPDGWPGTGLLLLRIVLCAVLIHQAATGLAGLYGPHPANLQWPAAAGALFLLVGLWTPVTGLLVGLVEVWVAVSQPGDPWMAILVGSLGVGLAMLGPGAWSVDARRWGRRRIEVRPR